MSEQQQSTMSVEQLAYFMTLIEEQARTARESLVLAEHLARKVQHLAVAKSSNLEIAAQIGVATDANAAQMIAELRAVGSEAVKMLIEHVQSFAATGRDNAKRMANKGT